ncbi:NAD-dependent epimerase/dehydratase family protein [Corallococcus praedator]|uniref:NAD-dependent epimerase/dehydratase family protein n=1 Tax=Corallococcus praedator TaxID=2316724 RepID=A0ABX9QBD4_9BACT|nr:MULTISPECIES: thioester reductase domain-containing protein [Corallococcus]RKH22343.1 NAD-dependent epimerase/dehydratase family protein [Corallococcus sp. CA031C]RKH95182.1 NAD-dependent epimerase/dehydratase family protein [Corallococcus praedator]
MSDAPSRAANAPLMSTSVSGLRTALGTFAREHLPEVMVPTRFVILDTLPKLPNGKVDRSRLPLGDPSEPSTTAHVAPATPEELRLAQLWQEVLGVGRVGVEDSFFDLGGDSVAAAQMAARVKEAFGVAPAMRRFFERPTIAELVRMIGAKTGGTSAHGGSPRSLASEDLWAEASLPDDIRIAPDTLPPATAPYRTVLLTGGTGYTGAYLVRELLDRSDTRLYVLARAKDAAAALERVRQNLTGYGLWRDADAARLIGVAGDLGRPYFGLTRAEYLTLTREVEVIIHNGAHSSYALPYPRLKAVNVLGTLEVLRLACRERVKPVHFVSSLAVFPGHPGPQHFAEAELTDPTGVMGGYRQTKWVGDKLVSLAGHRGLPVCIYRPGLITGAQDTGACSTDTFLNETMKGCIQLGAALDFNVLLEMVPVDFCARVVAHVALSGQRHGTAFHLPGARTVRWSELVEMLDECGYPLRRVPYATWYRELSAAVERGDDNALTRFHPLFTEDTPSEDVGYAGSEPHFDTTNLHAALEGSDIRCREVDPAFLRLYLDYFVSTGYLPPPRAQKEGSHARV